MLNIFPDLLFLQLLAPFMLRVAIGVMLFWIGYSYIFKDRVVVVSQISSKWPKFGPFAVWFGGIFDMITGIFLIVGFLTQAAAIAGILIAMDALFAKWFYKDLDKVIKYSRMFYVLLLVISISLLFTGAGAFAFDLPL